MADSKPEITFEIIKPIAVLDTSAKGWNKEINLVSWSGREPKFDIREWSPDHQKMGKGVTFSKKEIAVLKKALNDIEDI